ncbi:MAG: histidinol-phosphate transaminase [Fimbriimonadales bacterium]|nr:histidinol-phosphate transaminase [Fimbriimonadales bacterium]
MRLPIREHLFSMSAYSTGRPLDETLRALGVSRVARLASNENPLGPSPKAIEAMKDAASATNYYPDGGGIALREKLAKKLELPIESIVLGNGSDDIIHYLCLALLDEGASIVVGDPSFVRYEAGAQLQKAQVQKVALNDSETHDLNAMAHAIDETTRLVFIANPNNPTGTIVRRVEFDAFLADLPPHVVVALDEAYFEFVSDHDFASAREYLVEGYPVVGLRTFSKAYGLAGIRIGYGFMPAELSDAIDRIREPFNTNALAHAAAIAALNDIDHLRNTLDTNRTAIKRISSILNRYGATTTETHANFVWARFDEPTAPMVDALAKHGVFVRGGAMFGRPNCIRVSMGTENDLDLLENAMATVTTGAQSR